MNRHEYAKTLLQFRGNSISLLKFLGPKWIIVKLAIGCIGTAALFCPHMPVKCGGVFLLGYFVGGVGADLRRHFWGKKRWALQQELFDWNKIESLAKENDKDANT